MYYSPNPGSIGDNEGGGWGVEVHNRGLSGVRSVNLEHSPPPPQPPHLKSEYEKFTKEDWKTEPVFENDYRAQESIPINRFCQAGNRFLGSLKGLQIRALEMWSRDGGGGSAVQLEPISSNHDCL
jgi:hypothetical protein